MAREPIWRDKVYAEIERIEGDLQEEDGVVVWGANSKMEDGLEAYLKATTPARDYRREARDTLERYLRANKFKREPDQLSLFQPNCIVPLGENRYIRMADMRLVHMRERKEVRIEAHLRESEDYVDEMRYLNEREKKFQSTEETLLDVEKRDFDWQQGGMDKAA